MMKISRDSHHRQYHYWAGGRIILAGLFLLATTTLAALPAEANVGGATIKANFGIDADVRADTTERNGGAGLNTDDWFHPDTLVPGVSGTGIGIIDTTGGGAFRAMLLAAGNTVGRNKTFVTGMNGSLGGANIDAIYARDHTSADGAKDTTIFSGGTNKNADHPILWTLGQGSTPQKNDLIDAGGHLRHDESDSLWLFAFLTTVSSDGNSHIDYEFFATNTAYNPGLGKLDGLGDDSGHTAWTFDGSGNITKTGDVIMSVDFENGGADPIASVRIWVDSSALSITPTSFQFTGDFHLGSQSGPFGYAGILANGNATFAYAIVNQPVVDGGNGNTLGAPWGNLEGSNASFEDDILELQLTEIGINLTALGLQGASGYDPCSIPLGNIFFKSRSSASFTSELKDFVGPYAFGIYREKPQCDITSPAEVCPGSTGNTASVPDTPGAGYNWWINGGTITAGQGTRQITWSADILCNGTLDLVVEVTSAQGCPDTCEALVGVLDNTAPGITCPADVTSQCNTSIDPSVTGYATATDDCDASPDITYSDQANNGTITRTWTATDDCGNWASCDQIITISDPTPPVITCPGDVTIDCAASTDPANTGYATATDNCDADPTITWSDSDAAGACPQEKTITRTWTATDDNNNSAQCVQTITVVDNTAPTLVGCPANVTVECDNIPAAANVTATDNCDPSPAVTFNEVSTLNGCGGYTGTITRTWTATDACGNQSSCMQVITVVDNTPPILVSCPTDVTVECDNIPSPATVTATDNCDQNPGVTLSETPDLNGCGGYTGTITRTWTATDACGNQASCTQVITVVDTTPPVLTGCPTNVTVECDDIPQAVDPTASDNCDPNPSVILDEVTDLSGCGNCTGTVTRTWTATDACGNQSSCTQIITVVDNTAPVLSSFPPDETAECDNIPTAPNVNADDNCDDAPVVTFVETPNLNGCGGYTGTIARTWTATDACGNSSSHTQTITVVDNTPPPIDCPPDVTIECDQPTDPGNTGSATASDNCDPNPTIAYSDTESDGSCPQEKTITRVWTATDACGNQDVCTQYITVVDNQAPTVTCPPDIAVQCMNDVPPPDVSSVSATDNCDPDPEVIHVGDVLSGQACPLTIARTYRVTDACGNFAECVQTITVDDTEAPQITCPANLAVQCLADVPPCDPALASATDNCDDNADITCDRSDNGGLACPGDPMIVTDTYTATDDCGNVVSCQRVITVIDDTPPVLTGCPQGATIECNGIPDTAIVTATDNCDPGPIVTFSEALDLTGCGGSTGTITHTWTATDICGNQASCTQVITVVDNTPPAITCPPDVTVDCLDKAPACDPALATATDGCDNDVDITCDRTDNGGAGCPGDALVLTDTYTATDDCGNSAQCTRTITVIDDVAPTLVGGPSNVTVDCDAIPPPADVTASDNCDPNLTVVLSETQNLSGCGGYTGTVTRTWSTTDACGNPASHTQIITVTDNRSPVLSTPQDIYVECGEPVYPEVTGEATATDNCDPSLTITYTDTEVPGPCPQEMTITRVWTATDACGNYTDDAQSIIVIDSQPPIVMCPPDQIHHWTAGPQTQQVTAQDNCADPEDLIFSIVSVVPPMVNGVSINSLTGVISYDPELDDVANSPHLVTVAASDGCNNLAKPLAGDEAAAGVGEDSFLIYVVDEGVPCVCMDSTWVLPGHKATIRLKMCNPPEMGGFDFLICYDPSGLNFLSARPLGKVAEWEYFTYRYSAQDNCGGGCPTGYVRLIGIADMPNGVTPDESIFSPLPGNFAELTFGTSEDYSFIGQCFNLNYCWMDCGDNAISSRGGDTLYLAMDIQDLLPGEDCLAGDKGYTPIPIVEFCHGVICIVPPPDDRGDINLNGIANEVADAVLFANYFIYGPVVLGYGIDDYYENRVMATDINDDGIVLTVADLVYLIRIITGDANPYPESGEGGKLTPFAATGSMAHIECGTEMIRIHTSSPLDFGGIAFQLDVSGLDIGPAVATERAGEMTVGSSVKDGTLRVLVYSLESGPYISAGSGAIVEIPISGEGTVELIGVNAADREGRVLEFELGRTPTIPTAYELLQNYPNPFNAGTAIRFRLPETSAWNISVYDIVGRKVRDFAGHAQPGEVLVNWDGRSSTGETVSSGIYFYRLTASSFTQAKKMVLVK